MARWNTHCGGFAEREVLERLNVTRQQGYLFAKPMPFNKLLEFMVEEKHSPTVAL